MVNLTQSMIQHANQALVNAYAPYSHFRVASCVCSEDDNLYVGVNVENASYGLTICAETSAICQMVTAGKQTIKSLVVMNDGPNFCTPCGACRQRIFEFSNQKTLIHLCNNQEIIQSMSIGELLPQAFKLSFKQDKT